MANNLPRNSYDTDIIAWANEQARLLRAGHFDDLDIEHIAEEIEDVGKSEQRELENRLEVLLMHLLKWQFQPNLQGRSWLLTVAEQRRRITKLLRKNPSLNADMASILADVYDDARFSAMRETGLDMSVFPESCPWTFEQIMNPEFWPE
jgi:hypothetical protein